MATIAPRDPIAHHRQPSGAEEALAALNSVRERTLALVAHLSEDQLGLALSPIMSPLVWDLAHIAAYEDLWLAHRHGGLELLRPDLAELYDAFETPRSVRGEIELLDPAQAQVYLSDVRLRSAQALSQQGIGDGTIYELVLRHELQHTETMRQTMALAGLLPAGEPRLGPLTGGDVLAGIPQLGRRQATRRAPANGSTCRQVSSRWARGLTALPTTTSAHATLSSWPAFQIALYPVTNASWGQFGGRAPSGHPDAPVCHVSWFEAEVFAKAFGARLPSEAEWEKAASQGLLAGIGRVWEWTSSHFDGYPGFVAHPYREYSEVFFGEDYRVLRGGSWATDPHVASITFRNWDLPIRSQIFAGLRLARDVRRVMEPIADPTARSSRRATITIDSYLQEGEERSLADDVLDGLTRPFKELPPKHFYDARGAELFDRICELPEYYPTRTERSILQATAAQLASTTRRQSSWSWARAPRPRRECCSMRCTGRARCSCTYRST